jgi:ABC-type multidrug transport system ATPase subunit
MILRVTNLDVKRGGRTIVHAFDLAVDAGEVVGIVGKNGCGKSTLLMAIAGVLEPTDGRVTIGDALASTSGDALASTSGDALAPTSGDALAPTSGDALAPTSGDALAPTSAGANVWGSTSERRRARTALGYVPENADPPGFLRANELWALCASARGVSGPSPELIAALDLDELAELQLERMSLGQRRRACLGAAFLGSPALLVLDEPDNGLDARRAATLVSLLRAQAAAGRAALVATHDRALLDAAGARIVDLVANS